MGETGLRTSGWWEGILSHICLKCKKQLRSSEFIPQVNPSLVAQGCLSQQKEWQPCTSVEDAGKQDAVSTSWTELWAPESYAEALSPQCDGTGGGDFGRQLGLRRGHEGGALVMELVP